MSKPRITLLQPRSKAGKVLEIPKPTPTNTERAKGCNSATLEIKEREDQRRKVATHETQIRSIHVDLAAIQGEIKLIRESIGELSQLYEALREQSRIKRR